MSNILLLEPDKLVALNLQSFLKKGGHTVDWQVSAQSGVDAIDKQRPDLIILDLVLAGPSGVEFMYELRSYPEWADLPIIIFTNVAADELDNPLESFEQLNIKAYYYKPTTTLFQLAEAVAQALQIPAV